MSEDSLKILIAEDDQTSAALLQRLLMKAGHSVTAAGDGAQALAQLAREPVDAILTDWMMPNMDGIELVRRVRRQIRPVPIIVVVTALNADEARNYALDAGADDYLTKPYRPQDVLGCLDTCVARKEQPAPSLPNLPRVSVAPAGGGPPFVGVGIAASTGGPDALIRVINGLSPSPLHRAAYFVVLHGPSWMLTTFTRRLQGHTELKVHLGQHGAVAQVGQLYVAPGEHHMTIASGMRLQLSKDPPENFVRPAADPLFRGIATVFGRHSLAVVLTGMGRDGSLGAAHVSSAGGLVVAQDPDTALARSMPQTVVNLGIAKNVVALDGVAPAIARHVQALSASLPASKGAAAAAAMSRS